MAMLIWSFEGLCYVVMCLYEYQQLWMKKVMANENVLMWITIACSDDIVYEHMWGVS